MIINLKQKAISLRAQYTATDEQGGVLYTATGAVASIGDNVKVFDASGAEVGAVKQQLLAARNCYEIFYGGQKVATVIVKPRLRKLYEINENGWVATAKGMGFKYSLECNGAEIGSFERKLMSVGDSYVIEINDPADAYLAVALMLVIDNDNDDRGAKKR